MNKYRLILPMLLLFSLSPMVHALDGQGTIEEVMSCSTGDQNGARWREILLFRLSDNNWFGVNADYAAPTASDFDSNFSISLVLMAFSSRSPVEVRATHATSTYCGVSAAMHWNTANDYIKVTR